MSSSSHMYVVKRDGRKEPVHFEKVQQRLESVATGLDVDATLIAQRVLARLYNGVRTIELDELAAQLAVGLCTTDPDYGTFAGRIAISNHQRSTVPSFLKVVELLSTQIHPKTGEPISYVSSELLEAARRWSAEIDAAIDHERDFDLDYFGFKTLEKSYLLKSAEGRVLERPQHLWMRVALALWPDDFARAKETYDLMSKKCFTHATPTLFNAGTPNQQLSSCFVAGTPVYTLNGVKNIEDVQLGDEVITHTGSIKHVVQLHKNLLNNRQIYNIKIAGTPAIKVTGNHRLLSLSDEKEKWGEKPGWNSVEYLRTGDWIAIPKKNDGKEFVMDTKTILDTITGDGNNVTYHYEYSDDMVYPYSCYTFHRKGGDVPCKKRGTPFKRYWKFTPEVMELLGIWFGDGSVTHGKNSAGQSIPKSINIVSYHTNTTLIEFVLDAYKNLFGEGQHICMHNDNNGMVELSITNQWIANIFKAIFKSGFDGKRLPSFFNTMSYEHIVSFLAGLVSSDGCVSKDRAITICLTNPPLVNDIFHLARSVGIPITNTFCHKPGAKAVGKMNIPASLIKGKIKKYYADCRLDSVKDVSEWSQVRIIDGITFMRLNDKCPIEDKPEYVFTLGVEDDHSYSVGGIIAENCFLVGMKDDSIKGIYDTLQDCAIISKHAGGIGLHCSNVRAKGSIIRGTNGTSNGLVPMLKVFNGTARYVDQGGGKRNGSFAIYLEPWHADVEDWLRLKLNTGSEEERARDLFYGLWIPDLFMERVAAGGTWTLFCPAEAPGLADVWGEEFRALYTRYEAEGRGRKTVQAQDLWFQILTTQIETGTPYLCYKDAANAKSNQQNLGTIKSSNLCVAPETLLRIDAGDLPISSLVGQTVRVWNGNTWSEVVVAQTGTGQELMEVVVENEDADGNVSQHTLACTLYHKFILADGTRVEAQVLAAGQVLKSWSSPLIVYVRSTVISVNRNGRIDDTYCVNEPLEHAAVFNGVLTGNCTEIIEYSSADETAVCNLASIGLPAFVKDGAFDFEGLRRTVAVATRNLDRVIDINFYPTPETKRSNMRHRPIGLGIQGLADVFAKLRLSWESEEAAELNQRIFEHIYYAAIDTSADIAAVIGSYETFAGSPASKGQLQFDLWNRTPISTDLDWTALKAKASKGLRNSLLVAPMPTASTSQILGYNECMEPFTSNIYTRRTLAGEFIIINKYLLADLMRYGIWSDELKQKIVAQNGSVQGLAEIPQTLQTLYKTAWEIKQRTLIDMAASRGAFICQSQSLNLFVSEPTNAKLTSMHFHAWRSGLKTGIYYLRTRAPVMAQKFTVDPELQAAVVAAQRAAIPEVCTTCSA